MSNQENASSPRSGLSTRYGTPHRRLSRRGWIVVTSFALAVAVALAAWTALGRSGTQITFKDIGYSTPDAWHASIDFAVTKDADTAAVCAVKALSETYAVVGWKEITIGTGDAINALGRTDRAPDAASGPTTVTLRAELRTESAAVSVVVDSCRAA